MLIAGLTLGLGILAVFLAIIYRISAMDDKAPPQAAPIVAEAGAPLPPTTVDAPAPIMPESSTPPPARAMINAEATVPADARLVASTVAAGRIVLTYENFSGTIVILVDPESLEVVGRLDVKPGP